VPNWVVLENGDLCATAIGQNQEMMYDVLLSAAIKGSGGVMEAYAPGSNCGGQVFMSFTLTRVYSGCAL
jgi:hypothetical protein